MASYPKQKNSLVHTYTTRSFAATIKTVEGKKKTVLKHPYFYQNEINKFKEDESVTIEITSKKPKRTEQQNRYLWGVYYPQIAQETGEYDLDYLHECFKKKFLVVGKKIVFGEEVTVYKSSTQLSVIEFSDFIASIYQLTGVMPPPTENFHMPQFRDQKVKK